MARRLCGCVGTGGTSGSLVVVLCDWVLVEDEKYELIDRVVCAMLSDARCMFCLTRGSTVRIFFDIRCAGCSRMLYYFLIKKKEKSVFGFLARSVAPKINNKLIFFNLFTYNFSI